MGRLNSRTASGFALVAAASLVATPAMAQGWGGGGWGHRRHNDDTGWIVGGIIGLGVIAAIAASAGNKSKRDRAARERDYRYRDDDYRGDDYRNGRDYDSRDDRGDGPRYGAPRYDERRGDAYGRSDAGRGIDGAVDSCVNEVERGSTRVDTVDSVDRDGDGWRVEGRISGGRPFSCSVSGNGRIRGMSVDGRGAMIDEDEAAPVG